MWKKKYRCNCIKLLCQPYSGVEYIGYNYYEFPDKQYKYILKKRISTEIYFNLDFNFIKTREELDSFIKDICDNNEFEIDGIDRLKIRCDLLNYYNLIPPIEPEVYFS